MKNNEKLLGIEKYSDSIIIEIRNRLLNDDFWELQFNKLENSKISLHLAIFNEPYLSYLFDGKKTIESRFSINRVAPYKQINNGDIVLLKLSSGPIIGVCIVTHAWFYKLDENSWNEIKNNYFMEICVFDQTFWEYKKKSCYATLIKFQKSKLIIPPLNISKKDKRGWVILKTRNNNVTLDNFYK